ncbi:hypothetical protein BBO_07462 [Beauveria brongniartii RCEF 3172]|uniref:Uncharacterized protein n=1 Tax=Beauveria brongniartii RCEF 3172 TaxID=1081107 RepID=A0A166ZBL0_9HYPO|nr:hypothetical protein BBO_07462 [Beauveria brongniartii RCEF 3172]
MSKFSDRPKTLKVSDFKHYLNDEIQLGYYQEINVAGSTETEVDAFYDSFLRDVFTKKQKFRVDVEARVAENMNQKKADFTIRYVRLGVPKNLGHPTLYITVNIGTYLRFYELPPLSTDVKDWAPGGGIVYELADDESKVWGLWLLLRDQVMQ